MNNLQIGANQWGFMHGTIVAPAGTALNTGSARIALNIIPVVTCSIQEIRVFCSAMTGTPSASFFTASLYPISQSGAAPLERPALNTSPLAVYTCSTTPAANTWLNFTGSGYGLTAGTRYSIVFNNNAPTPATQTITILRGGAAQSNGIIYCDANSSYGINVLTSTTAGSTWTGIDQCFPVFRLRYSDGSVSGFPISTGNTVSPAISGSYGNASEGGVFFTTPSQGQYTLGGVGISLSKTGTPNSVIAKLYKNTTFITSSINTITGSTLTTGQLQYTFFFSPPVILAPSSSYRITLAESIQTGNNPANRYNIYYYTFDLDAGSVPLKPMNGTFQYTHLTNSVWTNDPGLVPIIGMFSDSDQAIYTKTRAFGAVL